MDALNLRLPERFLAEMEVHLGQTAAADIVEFDHEYTEPSDTESPGVNGTTGGLAVATKPAIYAPPTATHSIPIQLDDVIEVKVYDMDRARRVVAVVELVSPANKDRPQTREAFAMKALGYLKTGVGVVTVDIVTDKLFNLHNELIRLAKADDRYLMADSAPTYAVAYRPVYRNQEHILDVWPHPLTVGAALPTVPLALLGYGCVSLDLEATYSEACAKSRIT